MVDPDTELVDEQRGAADEHTDGSGQAGADLPNGADGVTIEIVSGWSPLRGPDIDGDEGVQEIDPNAWSLNWEERSRQSAAEDDQPRVPVTDETWFVEAGDVLAQAYCVTLVRGVSAQDALSRVGATSISGTRVSFDDLVEDEVDHNDDEQVVGASEVGDWAVLLEENGFTTNDPERKQALSAGTTVVTLYLNFNGANEFSVTADGVEELSFDRLYPAERTGTRASDLDSEMRAAGFIYDEEAAAAADTDGMRGEVAGCVLVERLTGVRLTVGLLGGLTWQTGLLTY